MKIDTEEAVDVSAKTIRELIDVMPDELEDLMVIFDQTQGDAQVKNEAQYLLLKVIPYEWQP